MELGELRWFSFGSCITDKINMSLCFGTFAGFLKALETSDMSGRYGIQVLCIRLCEDVADLP